MNIGKFLVGAGVAVGLMSSTGAMAAQSSAAKLAPVQGVRSATALKHKSNQAGTATGTYIVGGLAAAAVIAGIVVVASDDNNKTSSSPG
ncbi:MAG: hypothetical protein ACTHMG_10810 [Sphingomonas sp.]